MYLLLHREREGSSITHKEHMGGTAAHIYDPDTEDLANAGLKPVAVCVQCNRFSLSEIIICKGARTPKHKGWRYQVVRA